MISLRGTFVFEIPEVKFPILTIDNRLLGVDPVCYRCLSQVETTFYFSKFETKLDHSFCDRFEIRTVKSQIENSTDVLNRLLLCWFCFLINKTSIVTFTVYFDFFFRLRSSIPACLCWLVFQRNKWLETQL